MVDTNPRLSIRQGSIRAGISRSQYHTVMQKLQLKPYHPTLIVDLNEGDFNTLSQSSDICLENFNYDPALLDHIPWSDECKFNRNGTVNRRNCTYCSTENPHVKFSVPNTEERMMVGCGFSSNGLLVPFFFDETVTGSTYRQMLVAYTWPQLQRKGLYFQHNGAAPHYAAIVHEWLDEKFPGRWIGRHGWPARSSDLKPCDFFLSGYRKDIVFKEPFTFSEQNSEACAGIPRAMCGKVCHSVAQRLRDCLEKYGQFLSS